MDCWISIHGVRWIETVGGIERDGELVKEMDRVIWGRLNIELSGWIDVW